ncbi:10553_t:CDS:2, partial [Acaulospora morrowiae]
AGLYNNPKSRKLLVRILWLLTLDDSQGNISRVFETYNNKSEVPTWYWITFIPQLIVCLMHKEARHARTILMKIAKQYPQALHFQLRTAKEEYKLIKKQAAIAAAQARAGQMAASKVNAPGTPTSMTQMPSTTSGNEGIPLPSTPQINPSVMNGGGHSRSVQASPEQSSPIQTSPGQITPQVINNPIPQSPAMQIGNGSMNGMAASPPNISSQTTNVVSNGASPGVPGTPLNSHASIPGTPSNNHVLPTTPTNGTQNQGTSNTTNGTQNHIPSTPTNGTTSNNLPQTPTSNNMSATPTNANIQVHVPSTPTTGGIQNHINGATVSNVEPGRSPIINGPINMQNFPSTPQPQQPISKQPWEHVEDI